MLSRALTGVKLAAALLVATVTLSASGSANAEQIVEAPSRYQYDLGSYIHAAALPDGSRVYVDPSAHRVVREFPRLGGQRREGIVLGADGRGSQVTADNPTQTRLNAPEGVAVGGDFAFVADTKNHRVLAVSLSGQEVRVILGDGVAGSLIDYDNVSKTRLKWPSSVAVRHNGALLVADRLNNRVLEVFLRPDGTGERIRVFAGSTVNSGLEPSLDESKPRLHPSEVTLRNPTSVVVGPDDTVFIAEFMSRRVLAVRDNQVRLVYGSRAGDKGNFSPNGLALLNNGVVLVRERAMNVSAQIRFRLIAPDDELQRSLDQIEQDAIAASKKANRVAFKQCLLDLKNLKPPAADRAQFGTRLRVLAVKERIYERWDEAEKLMREARAAAKNRPKPDFGLPRGWSAAGGSRDSKSPATRLGYVDPSEWATPCLTPESVCQQKVNRRIDDFDASLENDGSAFLSLGLSPTSSVDN